jgi:GH15 family glucan-1,4-alpha-glucosidase
MTVAYWRDWVRQLTVPLEWQEAVIRAAVTLKLSSFEETGAIVAAMTTSIPEIADSGRNWDYRYCWLRDAFFVVRALNRLGAASFLENYLRYLLNILVVTDGGALQPVYGIALESRLVEREVSSLSGYRGMGPVRVGNQAFEHMQHDTYGHVVCAATQAFFDRRLVRPAGRDDFERLEAAGEHAFRLHDVPDAGMWELRSRARVHTSSSVLCWAACDRLAKIAGHLGLDQRVVLWRDRADQVRGKILDRAWNPELASFAESFDGDDLDAGLLLMSEVGFLHPTDERFASTVSAMEKVLRRGDHLMRYVAADDLGRPQNAFNICTFWYIEVLVGLGRIDEAREIFGRMLESRNHLGLLSEDIDPTNGELWGNFPQTYSLVGVINVAMQLSEGWETIL